MIVRRGGGFAVGASYGGGAGVGRSADVIEKIIEEVITTMAVVVYN